MKNYKRHIERFHKDKDPRNLKDKNNQSITLWASSKRKRDSDSEASDSQTHKRRHKSGDSGWGTGDEEDELDDPETGDRDRDKELDSHGGQVEGASDQVPVAETETETETEESTLAVESNTAREARTVYVKGFDTESTTLDELLDYFNETNTDVVSIQMRNYPVGKGWKFKGSIFVTFKNAESATAFVENKEWKYKDKTMIIKFQKNYLEDKQLTSPGEENTTEDTEEVSLGSLLVHDPLASPTEETEEFLGSPLALDPPVAPLLETDESPGHLPAQAVSTLQETGTFNEDLLQMLRQLKLGQHQAQLNLDKIQEGIDKIRLSSGSKARVEETSGPSVVLDPSSELSEEVTALLHIVRSIKSFEKLDFRFDEERENLVCNICDGTFKYTGQHEFKDENLSVAFKNLKKHVKAHLLSQKHQSKVSENQQEKERKKELLSRNRQAGLNIGRLVYKNVALRQAKRDFEVDVLLTSRAGGEVGNINHGGTFVLRLRPFLADAVRARKRSFLSTPTPQTGFLPGMCLSADGATYKRECRHFQGTYLRDY